MSEYQGQHDRPQEQRHVERYVPATMERTASRFESRIVEGIVAAQSERREIDELTARLIGHVLGRALGRASALADFGRTSEGTYEALRDEYLGLYADETTPAQIKEWIDWLGTYLVQQQGRGSGRRFMNESDVPNLEKLLVATRVVVGDNVSTLYVPASLSGDQITALGERLSLLPIAASAAFRIFLSLPDVDASSSELEDSFHESYVGEFVSIEDALYGLVELEEWETDLHNFAADRGILPEAVSIDHDVIEAQTREIYDLIEAGGVVYAFNT
jgi:hypothetical protein